MNPSHGHVTPEPLELRLDDGSKLAGRLWRSPAERALVAIVHGIGEHSGRYAALASDFADAGFTTAAMDWPGHGGSPGARGDASWSDVRDRAIPALLAALAAASTLVRDRVPRLFGHSLGGAMALDYALAHPSTIAGVVASSPALGPAGAPPRWKLLFGHLARVVAPGVGIPHGLPVDAVSRDPEVVAAYRADPLVHDRISARLYFGLEEAQRRILASADGVAVPALVLSGTADRLVDVTAVAEFARAAPGGRMMAKSYDGAYHELLNDLDRAAVLADVLGWLEAHTGALAR